MHYFRNLAKALFFAVFITFSSCKAQYPDLEDGMYAEFITTKGTMVARLEFEKVPITVASFVSLAEGTNTMVDSTFRGKKFYNGLIFHRVMNDFMIQGGDPTGTGLGDPGYKFRDEFHPDLKHDKPGILSMANSGPNSNGSQFFITEIPKPHLDNKHSVFGELVLGLEIQDTISNVKTANANKPVTDVVIEELNIIRKGKKAKSFEKELAAKAEAIIDFTKEKFNNQQADAIVLPSGLEYTITQKGTGNKLSERSKVMVHYSVYFENGKLLETSKLKTAEAHDVVNQQRKDADQYRPIKADIGPDARMIPGFKEGLQQLSVGDKATLFIPYHLAYGEMGNRGIPPKSNLIFEVEVVELLK